MKANVLIDYLSFTFRPEIASNESMLAILKARHAVEKSDQPLSVWMYQQLDIKSKHDDIFKFKPQARHYYTLLSLAQQKEVDGRCSAAAFSLMEKLKGVVSFLDYRERTIGYCGYTYSVELFRDGVTCGLVAWGGKNCGVYVSLSGKGLASVDYSALHQLISPLPLVKITRVDLAYDDFRGVRDFDWAKAEYASGGFNAGGNSPKCSVICSGGSIQPDGSMYFEGGRTFYVGARKNGKLYRNYEKGKQLISQGQLVSSETANWVRHEVEIHSAKRVIPLNVLLDPASYFVGAYPCLEFLLVEKPEKISIKKKVVKESIDSLVVNARVSYGKLVSFLVNHLGYTPEKVVELLSSRAESVPRAVYQHRLLNTT